MSLLVWLVGICVEDGVSLDDVIAADVSLILVLVPLLETTAGTWDTAEDWSTTDAEVGSDTTVDDDASELPTDEAEDDATGTLETVVSEDAPGVSDAALANTAAGVKSAETDTVDVDDGEFVLEGNSDEAFSVEDDTPKLDAVLTVTLDKAPETVEDVSTADIETASAVDTIELGVDGEVAWVTSCGNGIHVTFKS